MRRILFKGKRVDNGKWVKGNLFVEDKRFEITRGTCNGVGIESVCVEPETICQYTGVKDADGNGFWENDIVKGKYWNYGKAHEFIGVVKYTYGCFKVVGIKKYQGMQEELNGVYKTIGNAIDNQNLL